MKTIENSMAEFEDFIFNFQPYTINNEEDCQASLTDYELSKELLIRLIALKMEVLTLIIDASQYQLTSFVFDFLIQSLSKTNINLFTNIISYTSSNQA